MFSILFPLIYLCTLSIGAVLRGLNSDKEILEKPVSDSSGLKQIQSKVPEQVIWTRVNATKPIEQNVEIQNGTESFANKSGSRTSIKETGSSKNANLLADDSSKFFDSHSEVPKQVILAEVNTTKSFDHNTENGNESFAVRNGSGMSMKEIGNSETLKELTDGLSNLEAFSSNIGNKSDTELSRETLDMTSNVPGISEWTLPPERKFFNSTSENESPSARDTGQNTEASSLNPEVLNAKPAADIIQKGEHPSDTKSMQKLENLNPDYDNSDLTFPEAFKFINFPSNTSDNSFKQLNFSSNSTELKDEISSSAHEVIAETTESELEAENVDVEDLEIFQELLSATELQFPGLPIAMNTDLNEFSGSDESLLSDVSEEREIFMFPNTSTFSEISPGVTNIETNQSSVNVSENKELESVMLPEMWDQDKHFEGPKCSAFSSESETPVDGACSEVSAEVATFPGSAHKNTSDSSAEFDEKLPDINRDDSEATVSKQECPLPGLCILWFLARDECTNDNECPGSQICCLFRCSRTCIEV